MRQLSTLLAKWSHAQFEADHFREGAFLAAVGLAAVSAWLWVGQMIASGTVQAHYGLLLIGIVGGAVWLIFYLYRAHYLRAVIAFLALQLVFVTLASLLLRDLKTGYLLLLTVIMGGSFLGPVGSFSVATLAALIEFALVHFLLPGKLAGSDVLVTLIVLEYLAALISAQTTQGLYSALEAAEISAQTSQEHAEEARRHRGELHRTLKSLDAAYAQLQRVNAELLQAREIADAAVRFKKEFAAQTSHELRTPLNLIIGFSETMTFSQNSYGVKLPAVYLRDVTEIYRNSRHLLSLIDDILDLAKLDSGRMGLRFNLIDIRDVLQEVVETVQPLTQAKKLELVFDVPEALPGLWLDRARIHQVLLNLLSNAARLTRQGRIVLSAKVKDKESELLIQVEDTGPGIPPNMLSQVFEEFQQVDDNAGATGTTGLGLAISKRIIELHGGRIWAESELGTGTTFSFVLPIHKPFLSQPVDERFRVDQARAAQPTLVVLAEEGSDEIQLLQRHLDGFAFASASNWKGARQLVENVGARLIITDAPAEGTTDLLDSTVPVITCPLPNSKETAQALGIAGYLRKPLTIKTIRSFLRQIAPEARNLLVVGDDPSTLRLIERMLQGIRPAYQIFRAYTPREAQARIRAQSPDVILLDMGPAEIDGLALIEKLKDSPKTAAIPIIAISGREDDGALLDRPITISNPKGFTPTEILKYLQAILAVVPPATMESGTSVPPLPADRPA
ncbi:MAG TPA: ATP-binding protein [Anaerolineales bacterium]|nr:ATP-binding protein [Anaerolineales bacterium]